MIMDAFNGDVNTRNYNIVPEIIRTQRGSQPSDFVKIILI